MPTETDRARVTVDELASRIRAEMVPLGSVFSYFLATPIADEDLKQYLEDPIAALPQAIVAALPKVGILLVPFLPMDTETVQSMATLLVTNFRRKSERDTFCSPKSAHSDSVASDAT